MKLPQANRFPYTKSKSDTNLYKDFIYENQASKSIPFHGRKIIPPLSKQKAENYLRLDKPPTYEIGSSEFNHLLNQRRLTSFDIREHHQNSAIKSPTEIDKFVQSISNSLSQSELGQMQTDSLKSSNSTETHDVIKSYFKSELNNYWRIMGKSCLISNIKISFQKWNLPIFLIFGCQFSFWTKIKSDGLEVWSLMKNINITRYDWKIICVLWFYFTQNRNSLIYLYSAGQVNHDHINWYEFIFIISYEFIWISVFLQLL